jgi:alpha-L-arabinofuranosidase
LPLEGTGPGKKTVYLNSGGDLVIEVVNLEPDEQVDVQILISGELLSGTIYEGTI